LQNRILAQDKSARSIKRFGILHGRPFQWDAETDALPRIRHNRQLETLASLLSQRLEGMLCDQ
jgi:hypothetical protein